MMLNEEEFVELKAICIDCVKCPNKGSVARLKAFIWTLNPVHLSNVYNYILFPLKLILSRLPLQEQRCEETIIETCSCLSFIFQNIQTKSFDIFNDIYINLFALLTQHQLDQAHYPPPSEELKLTVIKCAKCLIESADTLVIDKITSTVEFRPPLGHSISILLGISVDDKYKQLKIQALETLHCLFEKTFQLLHNQGDQLDLASDVYASFLPGISIAVMKVITQDDKQSYKILNIAIKVLENISILTLSNTSKSDHSDTQLAFYRNPEWMENTASKLVIAFEKITKELLSHDNDSVRKAFLNLSATLLKVCCPEVNQVLMPILLRVPLTYLNDNCEELAKESDLFLSELQHQTTIYTISSFLDLLLQDLYNLLSKLPREFRISSEKEKTAKLNLLNGFLRCLGSDGINVYLNSTSHKQRLFQCLFDVAKFDISAVPDNAVVPLSATFEADDFGSMDWLKKKFKHFEDDKTEMSLKKCCHSLASYGDQQLLLDYLENCLHKSHFNPSVIYIANEIFCAFPSSELVLHVLDVYLSSINSSLSLAESDTSELRRKELLQCSLTIEGIAGCAALCAPEQSNPFLLKSLYYFLEKYATNNFLVSKTSYIALYKVANTFDYYRVTDLISSNIDYLVDTISTRLRHFESNPQVALVVKVILELCHQDILFALNEIIQEILGILDYHYQGDSSFLVEILYNTISYVFKIHKPSKEVKKLLELTELPAQLDLDHLLEAYTNEIKGFIANYNLVTNLEDNDLTEGPIETQDMDSNTVNMEEKKNIPFHIEICKQILERCVHLMGSSNVYIRLLSLDMVAVGLQAMKDCEDELLPTAHNLWDPLIKKFSDEEVMVIRKAFACLLSMSESCRDFIRARAIKDVLPKIMLFLKKQAKESYKKDMASAYRFTIAYLFQLEGLQGIGYLAKHLNINGPELWMVVNGLLPYLNSWQPKPLQEAALHSFRYFMNLDFNAVWYFLSQLLTEGSTYDAITVLSTTTASHEFEKNVKILVKEAILL